MDELGTAAVLVAAASGVSSVEEHPVNVVAITSSDAPATWWVLAMPVSVSPTTRQRVSSAANAATIVGTSSTWQKGEPGVNVFQVGAAEFGD